MLIASGRPADATRVACEGLAAARRLCVERSLGSLLAGYAAEGCLETGDWDRADELLTGSLRAGTAFWGHYPYLLRAQLAIGRGAVGAASGLGWWWSASRCARPAAQERPAKGPPVGDPFVTFPDRGAASMCWR